MMNPNVGFRPPIVLLKNGTDTSQGKAQLISNINACQAVVEAIRTTLGPRGMDKLIHDGTKVRSRLPTARWRRARPSAGCHPGPPFAVFAAGRNPARARAGLWHAGRRLTVAKTSDFTTCALL